MTIYKPFSIVVVPFPFTDVAKAKKRPALVISTEKFQRENAHVSLIMITTAEHSDWFGDFLITDLKTTGLPVVSYARQKIFTIDSRLIEKQIGHLSKKDSDAIKLLFKKSIAID
jgi:mRNA interferase MazF